MVIESERSPRARELTVSQASQHSGTLSPIPPRQSPFQRQPSRSPAPGTTRAATPTQSTARPLSISSPLRSGFGSPDKQDSILRSANQSNIGSLSSLPPSPSAKTRPLSKSLVSNSRNVIDTPNMTVRTMANALATESDTTRQIHKTSTAESTPVMAPRKLELRDQFQGHSPKQSTAPSNVGHSFSAKQLSPPKHSKPMLGSTNYQQIPPALLRSMRESFEVLDTSNKGVIDSAAIASMLEQMGLDSNPGALREFFPSNASGQVNLAKYLDMISSPLTDLSQTDELIAAFEAFDIDDSGQIDTAELRKALLNCGMDDRDSGFGLGEREIDRILSEFTSRRAFGAKGLSAAKSRSDVFRYRDFMAATSGAGMEQLKGDAVVI